MIHIKRKRHVPTGIVSLAAVARFAIAELHGRPPRPDWQTILDPADAAAAPQASRWH